jgi:hypothetical protein
MTFVPAFWIIPGLRTSINLQLKYWSPRWEEITLRKLLPSYTNERQWSINGFWYSMFHNQSGMQPHDSKIKVMATIIVKNTMDDITTIS